jgi:hypothetical protein
MFSSEISGGGGGGRDNLFSRNHVAEAPMAIAPSRDRKVFIAPILSSFGRRYLFIIDINSVTL